MISSRKGIISLPIKLMISFLILSLMVPPMMSAVDSIQETVEEDRAVESAEELSEAVLKVSFRTAGYKIHKELDVPGDTYLAIGGTEGHAIRVYKDGIQVARVLMDVPIKGDESFIAGGCILELTSVPGGVEVREI